MKTYVTMTLENGAVFAIPTECVAKDRAKHFAHEFDGDVERSLKEDTLPLFESDEDMIVDWALCNMNPEDFLAFIRLKEPRPLTLREIWDSASFGVANGVCCEHHSA